jgi:hypothetical protein
MGLDGKISVKHFLKKNLKPFVEGSTKKYPLYVRIRLDNKKTEFKSEYWEYSNINDLDKDITRFNWDDSPYVSEKEFSQNEFLTELSNEVKVISEIIDFYRKQGINVIDHNPTLTIDIAKKEIKDIVFQEMKATLMERLVDNNYTAIYSLLDWSNPFHHIIKALSEVSSNEGNPTKFFNDVLVEFDLSSIDSLLNFVLPERPRIYQWENKTLRNSLQKHLLLSVSKASTDKLLSQIDSIYRERVKNVLLK